VNVLSSSGLFGPELLDISAAIDRLLSREAIPGVAIMNDPVMAKKPEKTTTRIHFSTSVQIV